MLAVIAVIRAVLWVRPNAISSSGGAPGWARAIAPPFKWANRLYACVAWLDSKIWPRSLSTVLLIEAEKQ